MGSFMRHSSIAYSSSSYSAVSSQLPPRRKLIISQNRSMLFRSKRSTPARLMSRSSLKLRYQETYAWANQFEPLPPLPIRHLIFATVSSDLVKSASYFQSRSAWVVPKYGVVFFFPALLGKVCVTVTIDLSMLFDDESPL